MYPEKPSCLQATLAAAWSKVSSQTVPHCDWWYTSSLPAIPDSVPTRRTSVNKRKKKEICNSKSADPLFFLRWQTERRTDLYCQSALVHVWEGLFFLFHSSLIKLIFEKYGIFYQAHRLFNSSGLHTYHKAHRGASTALLVRPLTHRNLARLSLQCCRSKIKFS